MVRLAGDGIVEFGAGDQAFEDVRHHLRVGAGGHGAFLGAAQFGGRDHLHGLGDLPRIDYAADAALDVENVGHVSRSIADC